MSDSSRKPTKAQRELLAWMVAHEDGETKDDRTRRQREGAVWRGGALISYYAERKVARIRAEYAKRGEEAPDYMTNHVRGGYANHGWRRSAGTVLMNLERFGLARGIGTSVGVPEYVLTDEGRRVGREELAKRDT